MKLDIINIARIVHETHRVYCEHIGDTTQVMWEFAPDWQKNSTCAGVKAVMENHGITPEELHERWVKTRELDGWVYAPLKNVERKEHPCMMEYSKLDLNQRQKDYMFRAVTLACMGIE